MRKATTKETWYDGDMRPLTGRESKDNMSAGRIRLLELAAKEARISHRRLLAIAQHSMDVSSGGNYDDELKNSIVVQTLLDLTEDPEARLPDE